MKRTMFAIMMIAVCATVFAQTKKVAILETVDRENKLTYGVKLMLRSNLAKAVATTKGYEAYDRTDLDAILDEQSFQRTGYVSDADIKKIGEMTGVQYVLVAEASKVDEGHIFVSAKILNVESARMEMTDNLMMKTDAESLQTGAKALASKLLIIQDDPVVDEYIVSKELIERVSYNEYKLGNQWLTRKEYYNFINDRNRCIPAYQQFQKGLQLEKAGKWTTFIGGGVLIVGALTMIGVGVNERKYEEEGKYPEYLYKADDCEIAGSVLMGTGGAAITSGVTMWTVGIKRKNNAYQAYNQNCAEPLTLNLQYVGNGVGLALNF